MNGATTQASLASHQGVPVSYPTGPPAVHYPSFARKTNPPASAYDSELSIFDAEKYFNEVDDQLETCGSRKHFLTVQDPAVVPPRLSSVSSTADTYGRNYQTRSFRSYVTPTTASSEASWNSQTGLLSNPLGPVSVPARGQLCERKRGVASPRWQLFGTACPCLGRKSVSISERSLPSEPRSPPPINNARSGMQPNGHVPRAANIGGFESKPRNSTSQTKSCKEEMSKGMLNSSNSFSTEAENIFPSKISCQRSSIIAGRPFSDATTAGFAFLNLKPSNMSAATTRTATTSPSSPPVKKLLDGLTTSASASLSEDLAWDSLDVFQPSEGAKLSLHKNQIPIHRQPPRNQFFTVPPLRIPIPGRKDGTSPADNDDATSDASSDLFEIESFATLSTAYPNPSPSATPRMTESMYEPSEASVTWSVMTADGPLGDRGSVVTSYSVSASDVEEFTRLQRRLHRELELKGNGMGQGGNFAAVEIEKRSTSNNNGGGFLGFGQGPGKGSVAAGAANNDTIMPQSSGTTGGPTRGPMPNHASSRAPPLSKNGPCHSARVPITFAT